MTGQNLSTDKFIMYSKQDMIFLDTNGIKGHILEKVMSLRDKEFRSKNKICNCADLLVLLLLFYFNFTNNLLCNYVF